MAEKIMEAPAEETTTETAEQNTTTEVPKTDTEKIADLYKKHDHMVNVINNLITYLNTLEKWRTASFKPQEKPAEEEGKPATSE